MATKKKASEKNQDTSNMSTQMNSETTKNNGGEMIQIGGLWKNESKNGNTYLAGYLGSAKLMIFKNNFKKEDKHPDYIMYVTSNKPKNDYGSFLDDKERDDIPF